MRISANQCVVHLEGGRLVALEARSRGDGVEVLRWLAASSPAEVNPADAESVGKWIASALEGAGLAAAARRGVTFSASRGEVVLKRINTPPGVGAGELPALVRLQMLRQLTVTGDSPVIDFFPHAGGGAARSHGDGSAAPGGEAVVAAAMPAERLAWRRRVADAAGIKLTRLALAAEGAAALLDDPATGARAGAVLALALGPAGCELSVVENGRLVFARGVDVPRAEGDDAGACAALAIEAKRTWISYRSAPESVEVDRAVVLGDDAFARAAAQRVGESLEMPASTIPLQQSIQWPKDLPVEQQAVLAPLVGLLSQEAGAGLNLVKPRAPAPVAEIRRRRILLTGLAMVLVSGTLYTIGSRDLAARRSDLDTYRQQLNQVAAKHGEFLREKARVEHVRGYLAGRTDWVEQIKTLSQDLPDPREALLDELVCRLDAGVRFDLPKDVGKAYARGKWVSWSRAIFDLRGSVKRPEVRNDLRIRLSSDASRYFLEMPDPDVPEGLGIRLTEKAVDKAAAGAAKPLTPAPAPATPTPSAATAPAPHPTPAPPAAPNKEGQP